MSGVHRYKAVQLLSMGGGHIDYDPHGPDVVMAAAYDELLAQLAGTVAPVHPDDAAVDRFAAAMKAKLAKSREKGRGGWDDTTTSSAENLAALFIEHIPKGNAGNFEDLANLCMMLHQRGERPKVLADAFHHKQQGMVSLPLDLARNIEMSWRCSNEFSEMANDAIGAGLTALREILRRDAPCEWCNDKGFYKALSGGDVRCRCGAPIRFPKAEDGQVTGV
ncbi:hypothetical protein [Pseudomonas sp. EMN2]|uniref:hypothetical protein n=1 Tax=Pseudomonas sp. EMN2 TaxID=2615212 RepID=UPI0015B4CBF4|nr:hypothetical protein [Pseudomonas sp. EMN2]